MASPRRPTRLLDKSNIASAYPNELVADFETGDLTLVDELGKQVPANTLSKEDSGTGNAVTDVTVDGRKVTVHKGTFLTEHPDVTTETDSTSNDNPGYGGTFTAIDSVTRDSNGHVTKVNTKTITMPEEPDIPDLSGFVHTGEQTSTPEATPTYLTTSDIENSLTSTSITKALSANQGKVLDEKINNKLNTSGGTMTGKLVAQSNTDYTVRQVRNIFLSTSEPTAADGQNGDIWFVYDA